MKRNYFFISLWLMASVLTAQVSKTVTATSGSLRSLFTTAERTTVTNLTVNGTIDARDFKFMRDTLSVLSVLDLSAATVQAYAGTAGTYPYSSTYPASGIPQYAFYSSSTSISKTTLKTISLPSSITSIGTLAFYYCNGIKNIKSLNTTPPTIGSSAFYNVSPIAVYVPTSAVVAYKAASGWSSFPIFGSGITVSNNSISALNYAPGATTSDQKYFRLSGGLLMGNVTLTVSSNFEISTTSGTSFVAANNITLSPVGDILDLDTIYVRLKTGLALNTYTDTIRVTSSGVTTQSIALNGIVRPVPEALNVATAGSLGSLLSASERAALAKLTLSGNIDARDFKLMRDSLSVLSVLDLSAATIQAYTGTAGTYSSSSTTYPANGIPKYAFYNTSTGSNTSLKTITLPSSITSIGDYAFCYCSGLNGTLTIPSSVTTIATYAFYETKYVTYKSNPLTPPSLGGWSLGNVKVVIVPTSSFAAYQSAWNSTNSLLIVKDNPTTVSVTLTSAGSLADAILLQVTILKDVNKLVVAGPMNTVDLDQISDNLSSLISLDLKAAKIADIPASQFLNETRLIDVVLPDSLQTLGSSVFSGCSGLQTIVLPKKLTTIPEGAFYNCVNLQSVSIPSTLTTINSSAFSYCTSLQDITLPDSLKTLGVQAFSWSSLQSVVIPSGVKLINSGLFYYCIKLTSVTLPDSISSVGSNAFSNCPLTSIKLPDNTTVISDAAFSYGSLKSIVLPTKLTKIGSSAFYNCPLDSIVFPATVTSIGSSAFYGCTSIKRIVCQQPTPPVLASDPFSGVNKASCVLVVPLWSSNMYKQATVWNLFSSVTTPNTEVKDLPISGELALNNNIRPLGTPNVTILSTGSLTVRGTAPFTTNKFVMENVLRTGYYDASGNYVYNISYPILINETPTMTANKVTLKFDIKGTTWYYLSFPFNVNVSEISLTNSAQFAIRKYDGATRAAQGTGSSWKTMTKDSVLRAGVGYIFQCNVVAQLSIPATNDTRNQLFAYDSWNTPLKDYTAATAANKNWNFVGNPYPAYYDSRYIDFTAPITVWNGSSYTAVSLTDDKYALKPYEAFFVQKPTDLAQISFLPAGRQLTSTLATTITKAPSKVKSGVSTDRKLINLTLGNATYTDKCRVVINPSASLAYETQCDASKFMSTQNDVPQLYSLDNDNTHYAINERPLNDGLVRLGYYAGADGTYTIAATDLVTSENETITLIDNKLKSEVNLNETAYGFTTESGTVETRFLLKIQKTVTAINSSLDVKVGVVVNNGALIISAQPQSSVVVYAVNGVKLQEIVTASEQTRISVAKGIYLIRVGGKTFKSVVY